MSDTAVPASARPKKPRPQLTTYLLVIVLAAFTVFAARQIGFELDSPNALANLNALAGCDQEAIAQLEPAQA